MPVIGRVQHVGRRSGKLYQTPTGAAVVGDTIVIPLSFGNRSDWSRNVRAAGKCVVHLGGKSYHATQPRFVDAASAKPTVREAFDPMNRLGFRFFGIKQYLLLRVQPTSGKEV